MGPVREGRLPDGCVFAHVVVAGFQPGGVVYDPVHDGVGVGASSESLAPVLPGLLDSYIYDICEYSVKPPYLSSNLNHTRGPTPQGIGPLLLTVSTRFKPYAQRKNGRRQIIPSQLHN